MIKMLKKKGRSLPIVICDQCGEAIEHVEDGIIVYSDSQEGETSQIFHLHRGECDRIFKLQTPTSAWDDLDLFLARLLLNVNFVSIKETKGNLRFIFLKLSHAYDRITDLVNIFG